MTAGADQPVPERAFGVMTCAFGENAAHGNTRQLIAEAHGRGFATDKTKVGYPQSVSLLRRPSKRTG
ncbi:hypothetical protein [Nocardia sp. CA-135398]|uniref:hypothetical protein n=1 Tax=Nocardia sp. CA-135398 TaxID=3239977 RepID=UPI003D95C230